MEQRELDVELLSSVGGMPKYPEESKPDRRRVEGSSATGIVTATRIVFYQLHHQWFEWRLAGLNRRVPHWYFPSQSSVAAIGSANSRHSRSVVLWQNGLIQEWLGLNEVTRTLTTNATHKTNWAIARQTLLGMSKLIMGT